MSIKKQTDNIDTITLTITILDGLETILQSIIHVIHVMATVEHKAKGDGSIVVLYL